MAPPDDGLDDEDNDHGGPEHSEVMMLNTLKSDLCNTITKLQ